MGKSLREQFPVSGRQEDGVSVCLFANSSLREHFVEDQEVPISLNRRQKRRSSRLRPQEEPNQRVRFEKVAPEGFWWVSEAAADHLGLVEMTKQ